jgi:hypothetical protein
MKRMFLSLFIMALLATGCSFYTDLNDMSENTKEENNMPDEMPKDFNFIVQFGHQFKNEINTFEDSVTKDLIADGTATISIFLTKEEMSAIYEKMKDINIMAPKKLVPDKTNCMQTPHGEDKWEIRLNGETKTHYWNGEYCETTNDAEQLIELRNYILNMVKSMDEYKKLPEARGAYL